MSALKALKILKAKGFERSGKRSKKSSNRAMTGKVGRNRALRGQRRQEPAACARPACGKLLAGRAAGMVAGLLVALVVTLVSPGQGEAGEVAWERYSELGRQALQAKNYPEAREMFEAALREAEQISPWDMRVGHSLNDLAATYYAEGAHAEVAELLSRALRVIEVGLGPDHPDVAQVLKNLAAVQYLTNDYASAETNMVQAVEIWEASLGSNHQSVAAALNNLAGIYEAQGRHPEAAIALERSLLIWEELVGPDHEAVVESRRQLSELQRIHGLLPSAVAAQRPARQVASASSGGAGLAPPASSRPEPQQQPPQRPEPQAGPAAAPPEPARAAPLTANAAPDRILLQPTGEAVSVTIDAAAGRAPEAEPVQAAPVQITQAAPAARLINLHLGSYRSQALAEDNRSRFLDSYQDLLTAQELWVERVTVGPRGDFFRIMAGPFESASAAQDVCSRLQSLREDCFLRQR